MKIRIFALAKELGLDSKELITHCNSAGVRLKNSALASISPEERDVVLKFLETKTVSSPTAVADEPAMPTRQESSNVAGKIRNIRTMAPRPRNGSDTTEAAPVVEDAEVDDQAIAEKPVVEPSADAPGEDDSEHVPESPDQTKPHTRDQYIPVGGAPKSNIREMRPRGTISSDESGEERGNKGKAKPALPSVAAPPSYRPPKPKTSIPSEAASPKPDIPLTPEILEQQSPLKAHLQEKKKKKNLSGGESGKPTGLLRGAQTGDGGPADARKQRRGRRGRQFGQDDARSDRRRRPGFRRRTRSKQPMAPLKTSATVELPVTVRALSEALGRPAKDILRLLFDRDMMATINENLDEDIVLELAMELGVDVTIKRPRDIEQELVTSLDSEESEEVLETRPPIITILGHVDHGKTTMLDKLRKANVAAGEAGGITQHIAAYQVEHNGQGLTFVDTPGHAAFGDMRARGANVTDIVVLVVAADDGVMPQTEECISHARAAGVPLVVAMNKIDLPDTNEQKVLQELAAKEVMPAEWGGDVEIIRTSAETGEGLDTLLDTLLITAELHEFKSNPHRSAAGICLEAFRDEGRGPIAWLVVQTGTLRIGDVLLCGSAHGRIRAIYNDQGEEITEAGPSTPVKIAGLDLVPDAGQHFHVMSDIEEARRVAGDRDFRGRTEVLGTRGRPRSLEDILQSVAGGTVQDLPLIIKADTPGSIEALKGELGKLDHPEVRVEIVHAGVGGVNESDVSLASASSAIIIAFHVVPEDKALQIAEREGVEIRRYNIIYEVTATIRNALEGMLTPEKVQVTTGRSLVLRTFKISRFGMIAGCRVLSGKIERSNRVNVIRDQTVIGNYNIASLKREKDDAREVREGMECGIRLEGFNDVKEGDLFEAYRVDEVKRTLE